MDLQEHWDNIFNKSEDENLGWWEEDISQSLKFLNQIQNIKDKKIFLAGAGTSLLVDELIKKQSNLILNDISKKALEKLENRIGQNENIRYFPFDLSKVFENKNIDIWIDRAVLHFLIKEDDIKNYFINLKTNLNNGAYVLFAEFRDGGANSCASLPIKQYNLSQLSKRLGNNFTLIDKEEYDYISPSGNKKEYIYALFKKDN